MSYAIIENDVVVNIAEASAEFASEMGWVELPDGAGIGWGYEGGAFLPPVPVEVTPVLSPLSRRQLRLALLSIGVTADDIEAYIAAIPDPQDRAAALIEWQDASAYERGHPLLVDIAAAMGLVAEQVDVLWIWAAAL